MTIRPVVLPLAIKSRPKQQLEQVQNLTTQLDSISFCALLV